MTEKRGDQAAAGEAKQGGSPPFVSGSPASPTAAGNDQNVAPNAPHTPRCARLERVLVVILE
jgi:hypothetical protein